MHLRTAARHADVKHGYTFADFGFCVWTVEAEREQLVSSFVPRPEVEFAAKLVERYAAAKVPTEMQDQVRLEVETAGNAITIWECRPPWRPEYGPEWTRMGIARFRYSPSGKSWTVYWLRSDLKFHRYTLVGPQTGIGPLLDEVARDPHACFWG